MEKTLICEKIFAAVLAVTIPAEFIAVMAMQESGAAWATWLGILCAVLQLTAMVMVKVAHREGEQE